MKSTLIHRGLRRASRMALQPFRQAGLPLSRNDARIKSLKDIHVGRRAFIIGNGPSLKVADLDRLQGEITFASNKIYLAFDQTDWRPTYYSVADMLVAQNNSHIIAGLTLTKLMSSAVRGYFSESDSSIWIRELSRRRFGFGVQEEGMPVSPFSDNLLVGFYGGGSVTYQLMQTAYYMGIKEVILIGMDFSFQLPEQRVITKVVGYETALKSGQEVNHFHPDYRKPGEVWAIPDLPTTLDAYQAARNRFQADGRTIINASRQTKLEVFPRKNLDEILAP